MRTPVTLKIKFKSSNLDQFIERYSVDVSRGGIFIRTKEPLAVGTQLKFEFQLQDASSLISGEGTVVWIREHDPARSGVAPGMGVKFDKLAPQSQQVLDRILTEKGKRGEASMESRFDAGVRASAVASGNISTAAAAGQQPHHKAAPHNDFGGGDSKSHTPLPAPAPGLSDNAADEFGEESTRVMQDAVVQALANKSRGEEPAKAAAAAEAAKAAADAFAPEAERTTRASADEVSAQLAKAEAAKAAAAAAKAEAAKAEAAKAEAPKVEAPKVELAPAAESKTNGKVEEKSPPKEEKVAAKEPPKEVAKEPPKDPVKTPAEAPAVAAAAARPQQKSSALPMLAFLVVGVLSVVGYVFYRSSEEPQPTAAKPAAQLRPKLVAAAKQIEPTEKPAEGNPPNAVDPVKPAEAKPPEAPPAVALKPNPAAPLKPVEPAAKPGLTVPLTSEPAGATVTVDGKPLAAPTPTELTGLEAGKSYDVRVSLKGYQEWKTSLKAKSGDKLAAKLVATEKLVEVASTPPGADVIFDGKRLGKTPYTIRKLDVTKPHELSLKRAGFVEQKRSITPADSFESKDGKDVLAWAVTLEAEPKAAPPAPPAAPKPAAVKKVVKKPNATAAAPGTPEEKPAAPTETPAEKPAEKPVAAPDKPAEKPAVAPEKPAEKPAAAPEKPAEKPAAAAKPAEKPAEKTPAEKEKANLKTPSWMEDSPSEKPAQ